MEKDAWGTGNSSSIKALSNTEAKLFFANVPKPVETKSQFLPKHKAVSWAAEWMERYSGMHAFTIEEG